MITKWFKIFVLLSLVSISSFFSVECKAYISPANMPKLNGADFTYGCLVSGRLYYRTLGTNVVSLYQNDMNKIIDYRFRFDPNYSVPYTCQPKGSAIRGRLPGNGTTDNNASSATVAVGCTIYLGTDYSMSINGVNSNINETNPYSYVPCPLDDCIWLLILPLGAFGFYYMRKRSILALN